MLGGHVFNTSQKRYQNLPIQGVSQVLQTSGRRSVDVLDVFWGDGHVLNTC